jgi:hypothetical protein
LSSSPSGSLSWPSGLSVIDEPSEFETRMGEISEGHGEKEKRVPGGWEVEAPSPSPIPVIIMAGTLFGYWQVKNEAKRTP